MSFISWDRRTWEKNMSLIGYWNVTHWYSLYFFIWSEESKEVGHIKSPLKRNTHCLLLKALMQREKIGHIPAAWLTENKRATRFPPLLLLLLLHHLLLLSLLAILFYSAVSVHSLFCPLNITSHFCTHPPPLFSLALSCSLSTWYHTPIFRQRKWRRWPHLSAMRRLLHWL